MTPTDLRDARGFVFAMCGILAVVAWAVARAVAS